MHSQECITKKKFLNNSLWWSSQQLETVLYKGKASQTEGGK